MKAGIHRWLLLVGLFAMQLFTTVTAQGAPWALQPVDQFGDQGNDNSLALDSRGRPHVSYREFDWWKVTDYLKYASWNGISWQVQYVDTAGDVGFASSLAIDGADIPSIAYHDSSMNLRYAKWEGGGWKVSTIGKGANPFLALDPQGRAHISYFLAGTTRTDLMYAFWDGTQWQRQTVEQGGNVGRDNALAMDSKGRPHIVYRDYGILAARVKYATWDGTAWRISVIEEKVPDAPSRYLSEQNFSIAIDSRDRPHVTYFGPGYSLRYSFWNGSSWEFQTVDSNPGMYELPNSLALDSQDRPHVVFHAQRDVPSSVKYARWDGSSWIFDTVDSGNVPGLRNSLKIDDKDEPHISYYVGINGEGGGALRYARIGTLRTVTALPPGGLYDAQLSVKLSSGESSDAIYFSTDGSEPTRYSTRYSEFYPVAIPADRTTTLKFFAVDSRGNEGMVQSEVYVVDTSTPIYTLTVQKEGSGSGGARASDAAVPFNGVTAALRYTSGSRVVLTPETEFGSVFTGWSGDCSGTGPCEITMDGAKSVTASYNALVAASGFTRISTGAYHSMILNSEGGVATWGHNGNGQLGDGTTAGRRLPKLLSGLRGVKEIAAGGGHTVALKEDGTVLSWGLNGSGQLGDGSKTSRLEPGPVPGLSGVTAVAAGFGHSLALKQDGTVVAWGVNLYGQLGDGGNTDRLAPTPVPGLTGVKAISAGTYHSMALKNDGTVVAWGYNASGRLGDGSTANRNAPSRVTGLTGVTAIAAGTHHSLALRYDGSVWGWGANTEYQLGDWGFFQQVTPKEIPRVSGASAIAAGGIHSLALKSDGTVMSWGDNANGQLGLGNNSDRIGAESIPGLSRVTAVSAGMYHSLVLKEDGMALAWGLNSTGEVGDGTDIPRTAPVQVKFGLGPFTVSLQGGVANGTVSCTSPVSYNKESVCMIQPAPGYFLARLEVNGIDRRAEVQGGLLTINGVREDHKVVASFAAAATLTLNFSGTGGGAVHGSKSCTKGAECLPESFAPGSVLTLIATPDADSRFIEWSGDCIRTDSSCSVTMIGDKTVTAAFEAVPRVRIFAGDGYTLLGPAYSAAASGDAIQARAVELAEGELVFARNVVVRIMGGYDRGFALSQGKTIVKGRLFVRRGRVRVSNLVLRGA